MEVMGKIAAVSLTAAVMGVLLRRYVPELAALLVLCAGMWIVAVLVGAMGEVADLIGELAALAGLADELIAPVLKTVLLSILTKLTVELCRSAGEGGIAAFVELAGTVLALAVSLPLVRAVSVLMMELLQ